MGSTTANGYPYPVGTDRVMDGDDAIKALAEKVDTQLGSTAAGQCTASTVAQAAATVTVTFPAGRFTTPPFVTVSGNTNSTYVWSAGSVTTTSVPITARYYLGTATTATVNGHWIART